MDMKRREFLKIAGLSTIAGLGAPLALEKLVRPGFANESEVEEHGAEPQHGAEQQAAVPVGKKLGMVIDQRVFAANPGLAAKCIKACHLVHNVPDYRNKKDEIKWIWETAYEHAFPTASQYHVSEEIEAEQFMVLCNHCNNPPCVRVCPTKATFVGKDGKVLMDYHRCIGCRFCMAACPYQARSFNWRNPRGKDADGRYFIDRATLNKDYPTRMRGVVEKCNFCSERLGHGLDPACVEVAASLKGIVYGDLNDPQSEISEILKTNFTIQRKPELGTQPSIFYIV
jgi:Fe-S-cluster-containing dehydrogenase component